MTQKYTLEEFEAAKQAREERQAREEQERQERAEKEAARRAWIRDGGTNGDFERAWPELRDEARKRRIMDADQRAREEMRASGVSRI